MNEELGLSREGKVSIGKVYSAYGSWENAHLERGVRGRKGEERRFPKSFCGGVRRRAIVFSKFGRLARPSLNSPVVDLSQCNLGIPADMATNVGLEDHWRQSTHEGAPIGRLSRSREMDVSLRLTCRGSQLGQVNAEDGMLTRCSRLDRPRLAKQQHDGTLEHTATTTSLLPATPL